MTVKIEMRPFHTGDITVISNITSVTVTGDKVSRIGAIEGQEGGNPAAIHVDLNVKHKSDSPEMPGVLGSTKELGLILSTEDVVEVGLLLVAMGMVNKTGAEVTTVLNRLSDFITELGGASAKPAIENLTP